MVSYKLFMKFGLRIRLAPFWKMMWLGQGEVYKKEMPWNEEGDRRRNTKGFTAEERAPESLRKVSHQAWNCPNHGLIIYFFPCTTLATHSVVLYIPSPHFRWCAIVALNSGFLLIKIKLKHKIKPLTLFFKGKGCFDAGLIFKSISVI